MAYSVIDLHCHSLASDGSLVPEEVVQRAADNGVRCLSLTDHDTVDGLVAAESAAARLGLEFVSGIELSCIWRHFTIHVLGYCFDPGAESMKEAVKFQKQARLVRANLIAEKLEKKGFSGLLERAMQIAENGVPGRPHFAQAMVDLNYAASISEAFKKWLGAGKAGDIKSVWPTLEQVVSWITESGGTAIIAHPRKYNMTLSKLRELIVEFKAFGGHGIEVVTSGQKQGEIGLLSDLCQRHDLLGSVGSDFHTPKYPWAELGRVPALPKSIRPVWEQWGLQCIGSEALS